MAQQVQRPLPEAVALPAGEPLEDHGLMLGIVLLLKIHN